MNYVPLVDRILMMDKAQTIDFIDWLSKNLDVDRVQLRARLYTITNREQRNRNARNWAKNNRESVRARTRKWREENPERAKANVKKWKYALRSNTPEELLLSGSELEKMRAEHGNNCAYCGKYFDRLEVEHIFPVSRGGFHSKDNVTFVCFNCNQSKKNKTIEEFVNTTGRNLSINLDRPKGEMING